MLAVGPTGPQYCWLFAWHKAGREPTWDVDTLPSQDGPVVQQSAPGIAGMLQRALQERGMVMGMSSSEDEDSGEEDDEWDD